METTMMLIRAAHAGDKEARDRLVTENVGLIWSVVRRFGGRGVEMEDLFQIGSIGLIKAIDKFDEQFDVKFSTYAVPMITGEIKRFLRDDGMIKVSRTLKENARKVKLAEGRLSHELGRDATLDEIAAASELSVEDIVMAMEANIEVSSIYQTIYQGDGSEIYLVDKVAGQGGEKEKLINHIVLEQLLKTLPENEGLLIKMRYFQEKTQTEVAKVLGISQVQVSRLERKILHRMRSHFDV